MTSTTSTATFDPARVAALAIEAQGLADVRGLADELRQLVRRIQPPRTPELSALLATLDIGVDITVTARRSADLVLEVLEGADDSFSDHEELILALQLPLIASAVSTHRAILHAVEVLRSADATIQKLLGADGG